MINHWVEFVDDAADSSACLFGAELLAPFFEIEQPDVCDLLLLNSSRREILSGASVGLFHSNRKGWSLFLRNVSLPQLPEPPFLLSTDLSLRVIFDGTVCVAADPPLEDYEVFGHESLYFYVGCRDWFGALHIPRGASRPEGRFIAFSSAESAAVTAGQILFNVDGVPADESAGRFGVITAIADN